MSYEDKIKLQTKCLEFVRKAKEICGQFVSVADIYEKKRIKQQQFLEHIQERINQNIETWKSDQLNKRSEVRSKKQKQMEQLLSELKQKEMLRKEEQFKLDYESMRNDEKTETEELLAENFSLTERISKYQALNDAVDKEQEAANVFLEKLKIISKAEEPSDSTGTR
jgi:hypothetical protein